MKNKNSNLFPVLTGLLIGGAAVYFFKSEKGQQMIDLVLEKGETVKNKIAENSKDIIDSSQKALDTAIVKSKENLADLAEEAKEVANTKLDELDNGIQKAKSKLSNASR